MGIKVYCDNCDANTVVNDGDPFIPTNQHANLWHYVSYRVDDHTSTNFLCIYCPRCSASMGLKSHDRDDEAAQDAFKDFVREAVSKCIPAYEPVS